MKEITRNIYDESVICYERDDIIDRLEFETKEEELICLDIINSIEKTASEFLKEGKPAFLPFAGTYGLNPNFVDKFKQKNKIHELKEKRDNNEISKSECNTIIKDICDKSSKNRDVNYNYLNSLRYIRELNKKRYARIIGRFGLKRAEKYIETLASMSVIEFDQEIEDLYNTLKDED